MTIPKHYLKMLAVAILIGLAVFAVMALIMRAYFIDFNPTAYITAIAILAIALMTVVSVLMTSSQLDVMSEQLKTMQESRKLDAQPLPIISIENAVIEPPRFFCSPADDTHSFNMRLRISYSIKNHTDHPAINLTATAGIALSGSKESAVEAAPLQLDILPPSQTFPGEDQPQADFLFASDKDDEILASLKNKIADKLPVVAMQLVYSNIAGACFTGTIAYRLTTLKSEDEELIAKWHSLIAAFPVEYKDQLMEMESLKKDKNDAEWQKRFDAIDKKLKTAAGKNDLAIALEKVPDSFQIAAVSMK